jgi:hypothetical protein
MSGKSDNYSDKSPDCSCCKDVKEAYDRGFRDRATVDEEYIKDAYNRGFHCGITAREEEFGIPELQNYIKELKETIRELQKKLSLEDMMGVEE